MSFVQGVAPNFLARANGPYAWDVDGNRYLDYIMGLGSVIIGHADPVVNKAAHDHIEEGISFSLPHPIEVKVAELLRELIPCAEMVRFGKNGSDVTSAAVRLARAYTRRDKVACCGYHGWQDWYIGSTTRSLGVPESVKRLTLSFPYNDLEALYRLFQDHQDEIACVIMEPVTFTAPQPNYLESVQELCRRQGAVLVFDEIITGFRLAMGGAQEHFGVTPDLACFGKAMANGFPLSAIVGRAEIMRLFEQVFFSFTHGGEAVSLAACLTTINQLQIRRGIEHLWSTGGRIKDGTNEIITTLKLNELVSCVGLPPFTGISFRGGDESETILVRSLFQQEALKRGILTLGNQMLSLAHNEKIIDSTVNAYAQIFEILASAKSKGELEARMEGSLIRPTFRRA